MHQYNISKRNLYLKRKKKLHLIKVKINWETDGYNHELEIKEPQDLLNQTNLNAEYSQMNKIDLKCILPSI